MARGPRVTAAERDAFLAMASEGYSVSDIAAATSRPHNTVSVILKEAAPSAGLDLTTSRAQRMQRVSQDFAAIRRLELGNRFVERLAGLLEQDPLDDKQASALRNLAVTFAVLVDKRRLEEGQSTENVAVNFRVWRRKSL